MRDWLACMHSFKLHPCSVMLCVAGSPTVRVFVSGRGEFISHQKWKVVMAVYQGYNLVLSFCRK